MASVGPVSRVAPLLTRCSMLGARVLKLCVFAWPISQRVWRIEHIDRIAASGQTVSLHAEVCLILSIVSIGRVRF